MKRRSILLTLVATLAVALPVVGIVRGESVTAATTRPNMLVIMADDMRADDLKYMPKTMSFLASKGTDFRNAFAPTPLCCPNRASFLTGKYAHNHKVWYHDSPWGYGAFDDRKTLATQLKAVGYRTGYIGKYLNGYGRMKPKANPDATPWTYVPNGWSSWRGSPDGTPYPESDPRAGGTYRFFDTTINQNGKLVGHEGVYASKLMADQGIEVLRAFTGNTQPWYLQINPVAPHHGGPNEPDDPYLVTPARPNWVKGKYNSQITRGPGVPRSGEPEPDISDKARITKRKPPFTDRERYAVRNAARQRAESLYALDAELSRVYSYLSNSGKLSNTVVVFTSDNGYMEGEHRWTSGKVIGFEPSFRMPMLMRGPGIPAGVNQYTPMSTIDLTASLLDWGNAGHIGDGRSIVPDIGKPVGWTRAIGYEAYIPAIPNDNPTLFNDARRAIGIRTARYFYVRYANNQSEFFDLQRDPNQLKSYSADPAYHETRKALLGVWEKFKNCGQSDCQITLPASLQADHYTAGQLRDTMRKANAAYYNG